MNKYETRFKAVVAMMKGKFYLEEIYLFRGNLEEKTKINFTFIRTFNSTVTLSGKVLWSSL